MRWKILMVFTIICASSDEQKIFDTRFGPAAAVMDVARRLPGFLEIPDVPNVPFKIGNGKQKQNDDEDEEDDDKLKFNLEFRIPGKGKGKGGKGKKNKNEDNGGEHRGHDTDNEDEYIPSPGEGRKKGHNPCGPQGEFCPRNNYIEELGLQWSRRVQNGTGFFIRDSNRRRKYIPIGYQEPNEKYGRCETPEGNTGFCRHLEHCILEEFRSDFVTFLEYTCPIPYGGYAGVCCPEESKDDRQFFPGLPFPLPNPQGSSRPSNPRPRPNPPPSNAGNGSPKPPRPISPRSQCGFSEQKTSRIVGGRIADPKAWVWMAALIRSMPDSGDIRVGQFCGGVLISEFHVLTAAHCVDAYQVNDIKIRLGEYDFSQTKGDSRPQDFEVISITVHEHFNRYSYQNDIALIKLARSAYFADRIKPICLPPRNEDSTYENEVGIVTGWGTIYYGGPTSNTLMEVSVPVWKQDDCKAAYTQPIEDTNLCAGVRSGSRDSCQGGPLQLQGKDRLWRVVGVVSWGIRCSEPGYPGVYTRVSKYINWIQTHL